MKQLIWGLGFLVVLVVGVFIYILTSDVSFVMEKQDQEASTKVKESKVEQEEQDHEVEVQSRVETNPFDDSIVIEELNDGVYQKYIHAMTHQKVIASEKWGFYLITDDRIQWLLDGLNVVELEHREVYREILERWASGDFTNIDKDHNTIWDMQNGTIGEATGILSPEEEQAYIESQQ